MEDFNQKQVVDETVQAGQSECLTDTAQVSKADSLEHQDTSADEMTTSEFHRLLSENTEKMNHVREHYEEAKIQAQRELDLQKDTAQSTLEAIQQERQDFEQVVIEKKTEWCMRERNVRDFKRKTYEDFTRANTKTKNDRASAINALQAERHMIFERYKNSGGVLTGDHQELLHPEWKRKSQPCSDRGGVDDGE